MYSSRMETPRAHIVLVEDTPSLLEMYETALKDNGYDVAGFEKGRPALDYLETRNPDLLLVDLKLPDMDGLELIRMLHQRSFKAPVIVMTGHGSINTAVDAMRHGARDFLLKPFNVERLCTAVENELTQNAGYTMPAELAGLQNVPDDELEKPVSAKRDFGGFIGTSPIMQKVYEQIESAAKSNATVFITGESGTGKEVCAEAIHKHSERAKNPFIPINCAAIPRDLMESELFGHVKGAFTGAISDRDGAAKLADGGTLFLDEIAEMNPDMQTKLLRFLQNLTFQKVGGSKLEKTDIRIICATNRNPIDEVKEGNFREDLFYRLHVLPLYMPPLRDRGADILDIAHALLRRYAREEGKSFEDFSEETEQIFHSYRWPGNIRQLQNVIRNIVVMHNARLVTATMLPAELLSNHGAPESTMAALHHNVAVLHPNDTTIRPLAIVEREIIERAIDLCDGNILQAAAALEISPSTIYRKKAHWENGADEQENNHPAIKKP